MKASHVIRSEVALREVRVSDLPTLFEHQIDPEAARIAAFPSRERDPFMAHWAKIMANPNCAVRVILLNGGVVGNVCAWTDGADRLVGYWIGREVWGRGVATAALIQFLAWETARPLTSHVAKHNAASIRVLLKAGFAQVGQNDEELVFRL